MHQKVKVWVEEPQQVRQRRFGWLTGVALLGGIGLVVGGVWVAAQLIVDPRAIGWINQVLPILNQGEELPETLDQIRREITKAKQIMGEPIALKGKGADWLLPIFSEERCDRPGMASGCKSLVELRLYHAVNSRMLPLKKDLRYELRDRIAVTGLPEAMVIAPLTAAAIVRQGSGRLLPLTEITALVGNTSVAGDWFLLSGEWQRGSSRVQYGRVLYYDSDGARLQELLSWTSPANQPPYWQQVTGSAAPELVVNQTLGLEPDYQLYQVIPSRFAGASLQLEPIALTQSAFQSRSYQYGLLLARNGLWASALRVLQGVKQQEAKHWSATAQAQLDLIALHARITKTEADREWASPTQQIVAELVDDRWTKALNLLRTARIDGYDVMSLLKVNADRFWKRAEVALRVSPRQPDLQRWGLLLQAIQHDRSTALNWLHKQQIALPEKNKPPIREVLTLLNPIAPPEQLILPGSSSASPDSASPDSASQIMGRVMPLRSVNPNDWLTPDQKPLRLSGNQSSYRIQVLGFRDKQWQEPPFSTSSSDRAKTQFSRLWQQLHLGEQPTLQITAWTEADTPQIIEATVQAVRLQSGQIELLAIGSPLPEFTADTTALALTPDTIGWLQPLNTLTLADLRQQQPTWADAILSMLWQEFPPEKPQPPTAKATLQAFGAWSVQLMELTGDNQPEAVLTLESEQGNRTLIFSSQGSLIYSDRQHPTTVEAIVRLPQTSQPLLILQTPNGYQLRQWSTAKAQFE
ncbi:MAG TPA: hypothetical protein V6D10_24115 [Trichocoleus sp.]|jgi:hypothetical protein